MATMKKIKKSSKSKSNKPKEEFLVIDGTNTEFGCSDSYPSDTMVFGKYNSLEEAKQAAIKETKSFLDDNAPDYILPSGEKPQKNLVYCVCKIVGATYVATICQDSLTTYESVGS